MSGNSEFWETPEGRLLLDVERRVAALLPDTWNVVLRPGDKGIDGYLVIRAADGTSTTLVVEAKAGHLAGAGNVVAQALMLAGRTGLVPLIVVPYAGVGLRRACEENNVNYLDLTGWASIRTDSPAITVRTAGAERDPRPTRPATITRLSGPGAGRIVRALLASREPLGVRALAERANVAPGTVSKVLKVLDAEAVVDREPGGQVVAVRKRSLVDRWTRDYQFLRANTIAWYLAPRGVQQAIDRARAGGLTLVGTGAVALRRYLPEERVPVTALSQLALYVKTLDDTSRLLGLAPTDRATANVILAVPYDPQLIAARSTDAEQLSVVDVGQTVADLLTLPGRGPEEADQLMDLLAEGDSAWN
jgi:DNA-binding transcriptional regulator YhcF (GntR family)